MSSWYCVKELTIRGLLGCGSTIEKCIKYDFGSDPYSRKYSIIGSGFNWFLIKWIIKFLKFDVVKIV